MSGGHAELWLCHRRSDLLWRQRQGGHGWRGRSGHVHHCQSQPLPGLPSTDCSPQFITFESTGPIWALLLSPTHKVRRADGSRVVVSEDVSWKEEFQALFQTMQSKIVGA